MALKALRIFARRGKSEPLAEGAYEVQTDVMR